jgi:hypothetical protein
MEAYIDLVFKLHFGHIFLARREGVGDSFRGHDGMFMQPGRDHDIEGALQGAAIRGSGDVIGTPVMSHGDETAGAFLPDGHALEVAGSCRIAHRDREMERIGAGVYTEGDLLVRVVTGDALVLNVVQTDVAKLGVFARQRHAADGVAAEVERRLPRAAVGATGALVGDDDPSGLGHAGGVGAHDVVALATPLAFREDR